MFYLDFEEKLEKLESEKKSLQKASEESGIDTTSKILSIEKKEKAELEKSINETGDWNDEIEKQFTEVVEQFKKTQTF